MVSLDHFTVVFQAQHLSGLLHEPKKEIDAKRVVSALDDGNLLSRRLNGLLLFVRKAGRSENIHDALFGGFCDVCRNGFMESEVDDSLGTCRPCARIVLADVTLRDKLKFL